MALITRYTGEHVPLDSMPFKVRVGDSDPYAAEIFFDSTGDYAVWQAVVRDFPAETGKALFITMYAQVPSPPVVEVELVLLPDVSLFGQALLNNFTSYGGDAETVMELAGYGPLRKIKTLE